MPATSAGVTRQSLWRLESRRHGRTCSGRPRLSYLQEPRSALAERVVEIIPVRIRGVDKADLPGTGPMLDGLLALNGVAHIIEALRINQSLQAVMLCKSIDKPLPMFIGSSRQIARDTDIQDAVASIAHEINPAASHNGSKARRGWPGQARP